MPLIDVVIDVSHWQDVTDPQEVVDAGIIGVICKATEGTGFKDEDYPRAKQTCDEHGVLFGAYHYMRPGQMIEQAKYFVDYAGEVDLYAADFEEEGISLHDLKEFLSEVYELTSKRPIIYSGHTIKNLMNSNERDGFLALHRLWLAQYTEGTPTWPTATWPKWWLWQYTDDGSVSGINGPVDRNRFDGTADQLVDEWTGEPPQEEPDIVIKVTVPQGVKVIVDEV